MIEADLENLGGRCIARDMAAQLAVGLVGAHHHGERVPAHNRGNPRLHIEVAGKRALLFERDGVSIGPKGSTSGTTPRSLALRPSADRMNSARSPPVTRKTDSSASSHSAVSVGSLSSAKVGKAGRVGIVARQRRIGFLEHTATPCEQSSPHHKPRPGRPSYFGVGASREIRPSFFRSDQSDAGIERRQ